MPKKVVFFAQSMKNFNKVIKFRKVIQIILTISFLSTNSSYGVDIPVKSALRVPIMGSDKEQIMRLKDAGAEAEFSSSLRLGRKQLNKLKIRIKNKKGAIEKLHGKLAVDFDVDIAKSRLDLLLEIGQDILKLHPELLDKYINEVVVPLFANETHLLGMILSTQYFYQYLSTMKSTLNDNHFPELIRQTMVNNEIEMFPNLYFYDILGLGLIVQSRKDFSNEERASIEISLVMARTIMENSKWQSLRPDIAAKIKTIYILKKEEGPFATAAGLADKERELIIIEIDRDSLLRRDYQDYVFLATIIIHEAAHLFVSSEWHLPKMDKGKLKIMFMSDLYIDISPDSLLSEVFAYGIETEFLLMMPSHIGERYKARLSQTELDCAQALSALKKLKSLGNYYIQALNLWRALSPQVLGRYSENEDIQFLRIGDDKIISSIRKYLSSEVNSRLFEMTKRRLARQMIIRLTGKVDAATLDRFLAVLHNNYSAEYKNFRKLSRETEVFLYAILGVNKDSDAFVREILAYTDMSGAMPDELLDMLSLVEAVKKILATFSGETYKDYPPELINIFRKAFMINSRIISLLKESETFYRENGFNNLARVCSSILEEISKFAFNGEGEAETKVQSARETQNML